MALEPITNRRPFERNPEAVAIGALFLVLFALYALAIGVARVGYAPLNDLAASNPELDPTNQLRVLVLPAFLLNAAGLGLGALFYARTRAIAIPFGPPKRERLVVAVSTVLLAASLPAIGSLVGSALLDTSVSAMVGSAYSPRSRLSFLVLSSFVPALLRGFGYGLLFYGLAHERLRDVTTPRHALVLTPLVVGLFWEVHRGLAQAVTWGSIGPTRVAAIVALGAGFGASVGLLYRGIALESVDDLLRPSYVPVFVVGLLAVAVVATNLADFPSGVIDALQLGVFALAAYGYERTRSIWVPILALAAFSSATDLVAFAESTGGLV